MSAASGAGVAGGGGAAGGAAGAGAAGAVQTGRSAKELLMTLPCPSAQTVSKYNSQYHKLFQSVPKDEILMKGRVFYHLTFELLVMLLLDLALAFFLLPVFHL